MTVTILGSMCILGGAGEQLQGWELSTGLEGIECWLERLGYRISGQGMSVRS